MLNNNRTQYSSPEIFWQRNQDTEPELNYTKLRFIHFAQRTSVKSNKL